MYLCASVNRRGRNRSSHDHEQNQDSQRQPLQMQMMSNSRLAIHSRRSKKFQPAKLTEWVNENEVFFINCQER